MLWFLHSDLLFLGSAINRSITVWLNGTAIAAAHGLDGPIVWTHYAVAPLGRYVVFATETESLSVTVFFWPRPEIGRGCGVRGLPTVTVVCHPSSV